MKKENMSNVALKKPITCITVVIAWVNLHVENFIHYMEKKFSTFFTWHLNNMYINTALMISDIMNPSGMNA